MSVSHNVRWQRQVYCEFVKEKRQNQAAAIGYRPTVVIASPQPLRESFPPETLRAHLVYSHYRVALAFHAPLDSLPVKFSIGTGRELPANHKRSSRRDSSRLCLRRAVTAALRRQRQHVDRVCYHAPPIALVAARHY